MSPDHARDVGGIPASQVAGTVVPWWFRDQRIPAIRRRERVTVADLGSGDRDSCLLMLG
jgi:hypothetical protein